mmetsp:Transcript_22467/g.34692  ORF Transcript_22467/g.34692 Transcript_22467/m.34692 type:complete len:210 (+) Transcript_22467:1545-2174(+)
MMIVGSVTGYEFQMTTQLQLVYCWLIVTMICVLRRVLLRYSLVMALIWLNSIRWGMGSLLFARACVHFAFMIVRFASIFTRTTLLVTRHILPSKEQPTCHVIPCNIARSTLDACLRHVLPDRMTIWRVFDLVGCIRSSELLDRLLRVNTLVVAFAISVRFTIKWFYTTTTKSTKFKLLPNSNTKLTHHTRMTVTVHLLAHIHRVLSKPS